MGILTRALNRLFGRMKISVGVEEEEEEVKKTTITTSPRSPPSKRRRRKKIRSREVARKIIERSAIGRYSSRKRHARSLSTIKEDGNKKYKI